MLGLLLCRWSPAAPSSAACHVAVRSRPILPPPPHTHPLPTRPVPPHPTPSHPLAPLPPPAPLPPSLAAGNPCTDWPGYRQYVVAKLPRLRKLVSGGGPGARGCSMMMRGPWTGLSRHPRSIHAPACTMCFAAMHVMHAMHAQPCQCLYYGSLTLLHLWPPGVLRRVPCVVRAARLRQPLVLSFPPLPAAPCNPPLPLPPPAHRPRLLPPASCLARKTAKAPKHAAAIHIHPSADASVASIDIIKPTANRRRAAGTHTPPPHTHTQDGQDIKPSERIAALQALPELEARLRAELLAEGRAPGFGGPRVLNTHEQPQQGLRNLTPVPRRQPALALHACMRRGGRMCACACLVPQLPRAAQATGEAALRTSPTARRHAAVLSCRPQ